MTRRLLLALAGGIFFKRTPIKENAALSPEYIAALERKDLALRQLALAWDQSPWMNYERHGHAE